MGSVLSIGKLATGQANYYLQQARGRVDSVTSVRTGIEDYYFDGPEPDGEWLREALDRSALQVWCTSHS